jgi:hypothetical protein
MSSIPVMIRYHFRQHFPVPPDAAYAWCTNFTPGDQQLKGYGDSERIVTKIADCTIILTDTSRSAAELIERQKLVHLYPSNLCWVATHLTGPNKYSQFIYRIHPDDKDGSFLNFSALHLEYDTKEDSATLESRLCKADSDAWKLLAAALSKDLLQE